MTHPERASPVNHHTWIGTRIIRTADARDSSMPFARCACGWEGPGRLDREAAAQDGTNHELNPEAS